MSELLEAVHEMAQDLHRVGAVDEITMREIDALCLSPEETAPNTEEGMTAASVASGGLGGSPS